MRLTVPQEGDAGKNAKILILRHEVAVRHRGTPEPATILEATKVLSDQPCVESCEVTEPGAIETRRPSLDDVFLAKTGHTLDD